MVHGGQFPIKGAEIYLLAASPQGYGHQSVSLITSSPNPPGINGWNYVLTDGSGGFDIPSGATTNNCSPGQTVYLYSYSGDAFDQNGTSNLNTASGLMAVLGQCGSSNSISPALPSSIQMNEVTTVAAAYALAGFATDARDIGSTGSSLALTGLKNAALNARSMVDLTTGLVADPAPAGVTFPTALIYTIADVLAACINSQNSNTTACTDLMSYETYNGTKPADTASAAINMAHQPGANVYNTWQLSLSSPPFSGNITTVAGPSDFALGIGYSAGGLTAPTAIAIDASGNAWVTDDLSGTGGLIELGPQGTALTTTGGYNCSGALNAPSSLALGLSGTQTAWVASSSQGTVTGVPYGGGTCLTVSPPTSGCKGAGLWCIPIGIAVNTSLYVLDNGSATLDQFDSDGNHIFRWPDPSASEYNNVTFSFPTAVAVDSAGLIWVTDLGGPGNPNFDYASGDNINVAFPSAPFGNGSDVVAIGLHQNEWVADSGSDSVFLFGATGTQVDNTFTDPAGGIDDPVAMATDGVGNAWIANDGGGPDFPAIAEMAADGSAAISPNGEGYTGNGLITNTSVPTGIAVDPSGNVWVSIQFDSSQVFEFIGLAAPTVTPLANAAVDNTIATEP
jgi:hypothetical protein